MRRIAFILETGTVGTDACEVLEFEDTVTDEQLNETGRELALNNAEAYGIYPAYEYDREDGDEDDGGDTYSDDISSYWEEYDPEKHDQLKPGGGTWF